MDLKKTAVGVLVAAGLAGGGVVGVDVLQNPYVDQIDHYELPVVADISQGDHLEISKTAPAITLSRWNDESRITITPKFPGAGRVSNASRPLLSKKMQFTKGNLTAFVEPSATSSQFDIDFTLAAKPVSNVFTYSISGSEDLDFWYQAPLNIEMASSTCSETKCGYVRRPENVVGSYAVYSKTKRNHEVGSTNYGTGKLFHIYRPKATDAEGKSVWATLEYANGVLSVIVPQEFLDTATYPVVVDPTIGYTTAGGSYLIIGYRSSSTVYTSQRYAAGAYTLASNATLNSVSGYIASWPQTFNNTAYRFFVNNKDSVSSGNHGEAARVSSTSDTITTAGAWKTLNAAGQSLTAGNLILSATFDATNLDFLSPDTGEADIWMDSAGTAGYYFGSASGGGGGTAYTAASAAPWGASLQTSANYLPSLYATYTVSASGATTNPSDTVIFE